MTAEEFNNNLNELISDDQLGLITEIKKRAKKMLNSGCVDLNNYANDYSLPKAFLSACLKSLSNAYRPFTPALKEDSDNIYFYI